MKNLIKSVCLIFACINIYDGYSQFDAFVDVQSPVTCAGGLNGTVIIGITGGVEPFEFSLDAGPGQASNCFSLGAGVHTVIVTDSNGIEATVDFNIGQPSALSYNTLITNASCNGVCNGQITITAQNATPPYKYSNNNGLTFQTSNVLAGLCSGNTNVVVKDANGCLANSIEVVSEPVALISSPSSNNVSCHGLADGEIYFTATGGTAGYTYSVDNGETFSAANPQLGITAGVHNTVVKDANGCQFNDLVVVSEPPAFLFSLVDNLPANCGSNDGFFDYLVSSGTAPYSYSIDGGVTLQTSNGYFGGLYSGLYSLTAVDANGCKDSILVALPDNIMTTSVDLVNSTSCKSSCDGLAIVSQQFGSAPFTYTINTGGAQASGVFTGLCAGQHFITIADNGLCLGIQEVNILEPDTITFTPFLTDLTCPSGADGQIDFGTTTGGDGGPYTYSNAAGTTFQTGTVFSGLVSGNYDLVAIDGNGCLGDVEVFLKEPPAWNVKVNASNLTCSQNNTGFIQIIGGGGTSPYTFDLSGDLFGPGPSAIYFGLPALNYNITVTDSLNCTFSTTQPLSEPVQLSADYVILDESCDEGTNGTIEVFVGGGIGPYIYSVDDGIIKQSANIFSELSASSYDIYVQDANGCFYKDSVLLDLQDGGDCGVVINNTFSPNNDGVNDFFEIIGIEEFPSNSLTIFNRWGDPVYEGYNIPNEDDAWDGRNWGGKYVPSGTYYYILTLGPDQTSKGWLQVVR